MEYASLIAFAISSCITPGPNNSMLMASGLNYGTRRSLPHYFGIVLGFPLMILAVGLGIAQIFDAYPALHTLLKIVGAGYLSFLAYKIATAPVGLEAVKSGKPFTFLQAAAFQWVNPKAWVMAVGAIATYTVIGSNYSTQVALISALFFAIGAPLHLGMALAGRVFAARAAQPPRRAILQLEHGGATAGLPRACLYGAGRAIHLRTNKPS
jgi:threonine/homoserine/homoserine lactone efflux protein